MSLTDDQIKKILTRYKKILIVGLSPDSSKASHTIAEYLISHGYDVSGVNPAASKILGRPIYPSVTEALGPLEIVNVFRRSEFISALVDELIPLKPKVLWLQDGITDVAAEDKARRAGITVISDDCILRQHRRLVR